MQVFLYTIGSVVIISLVSFIGILSIFLKKQKLEKILIFLVSLSAGTLLGGAFLHLIPEALAENESVTFVSIWILIGIICFFILEKIIHWRHCHIPTSANHPHHLGMMNLFGDALHNFMDGIIIAGSYLISIEIGIITTTAVIFHEIPQEIGDFGVLIHAGFSAKKALLLNFFIALTAVLGALLILCIGNITNSIMSFILPFAAGGFIYIATADLIPELKKEADFKNSILQLFFILIGIIIMLLIK